MTDVIPHVEQPLFDPMAPLTPSGNLRRRDAVSRAVAAGSTAAAAIAVGLLVLVVVAVTTRAAPALSLDFLFTNPSGLAGGGIANALLGTGILVVGGAVIAVPVGILTGIYLTEFASGDGLAARVLKLTLDLLQGLPTIIVGVVVYGLIVVPMHKETGLAGSIALSIVMLPLIARSSQEVLRLVPNTLREAADALGVERWRAVVGVILPAALSGIVTGAILSIARAAGETAPLVFTDQIFNPVTTQVNPLQGMPSIPLYIFTNYDLPTDSAVTKVWGAAFVLLVFILLANIAARVLLARARRRMTR